MSKGWSPKVQLDMPAYTCKGKQVWEYTSEELNARMAEELEGECVLAFSCGKDSIAAWIALRNYFERIVPVFRYPVPDLEFIEDALRYYEDAFGTEIVRVPHDGLLRQMEYGVWQTPGSMKAIRALGITEVKSDELVALAAEDNDFDSDTFYTAVGVRASDSVQRLTSVMRFGPLNRKRRSWWPIFDWTTARTLESIRAAKLRLPVDYHLFGRSFDGINEEYLRPLKERYPRDYERVRDYFPLVEADLVRHKFRPRHFKG